MGHGRAQKKRLCQSKTKVERRVEIRECFDALENLEVMKLFLTKRMGADQEV